MLRHFAQSLSRTAARRLSLFSRDRGGMAAVEFGLLVPIMLIMLIGTVEISQAVSLDRRISMATSATADLVAREQTLDDTQLDNIMKIVKHLLAPYDDTRMKLTMYQVTADSNNAAVLRVSAAYSHNGGSKPAKCAAPPDAIPTGLLGKGASMVVVKSEYDYEPLIFSRYLDSSMTLTDLATNSPRNSCVQYSNWNPNCLLTCG